MIGNGNTMLWLNPFHSFHSDILISKGIKTSVETLNQFKAPQIANESEKKLKWKQWQKAQNNSLYILHIHQLNYRWIIRFIFR